MALYRDYDQAGLDAQYDNRARHPDHVDHLARWAAESAVARKALKCRLDITYGRGRNEKLDVFPAVGADAPILMFLHGGYWMGLDKSDCSWLAPAFVDAGITFVAINYDLAPQVALGEIVEQCRGAVEWATRNGRKLGGDGGQLFLAGHSAGGHLAAMAMTEQRIGGACLISGVYDLEPIRHSYLNQTLGLDAEAARRNSPLHLAARAPAPLVVAFGSDESEEFRRQSIAFSAAWPVTRLIEMPGRNHFSILGDLADADGALFGLTLDMIDGRL